MKMKTLMRMKSGDVLLLAKSVLQFTSYRGEGPVAQAEIFKQMELWEQGIKLY